MSDTQPPRAPKSPRPPVRQPWSALWLGAALIGLLLVFNLLSAGFQAGRAIPYSEFKAKLAQGQITEIIVGTEAIRGTYADGAGGEVPFHTTRIDDPRLVEQLEAGKVIYDGQPQNRLLTDVLGWLLPLAAIVMFAGAVKLAPDAGLVIDTLGAWLPPEPTVT